MNRRRCIKYLTFAAVFNPVDMMAAVPRIRAGNLKHHFTKLPEAGFLSATKEAAPTFVVDDIKDYLNKIRHPDRPHPEDIILNSNDKVLLKSAVKRLERMQGYVGHGNFCILGYEDCLKLARNVSKIGSFSNHELRFMEEIFFRDAREYGFFGEKQTMALTEEINPLDIYKLPYNGNYLYLGESYNKYLKIQKEVGEDLVLTSGIRGLAKQFHLFLTKAYRYGGNLSLASRSIAPPGYSYHATGDFDVGQRGFGEGNFSEEFTRTRVFGKLIDLGHVHYRYERDNMLGVRYEPWHVKL